MVFHHSLRCKAIALNAYNDVVIVCGNDMRRVRILADIVVGCTFWKAGNVRIQQWSHEAAAAPSPGL